MLKPFYVRCSERTRKTDVKGTSGRHDRTVCIISVIVYVFQWYFSSEVSNYLCIIRKILFCKIVVVYSFTLRQEGVEASRSFAWTSGEGQNSSSFLNLRVLGGIRTYKNTITLRFYGEFIHGAAKEVAYTPGVVHVPVGALLWGRRRQALNRWGGSGTEKKKCTDGISPAMEISSLCLSSMESIERCLAVCCESALGRGLSNQTTYVACTGTEPFAVEWRDQILSWALFRLQGLTIVWVH